MRTHRVEVTYIDPVAITANTPATAFEVKVLW